MKTRVGLHAVVSGLVQPELGPGRGARGRGKAVGQIGRKGEGGRRREQGKSGE